MKKNIWLWSAGVLVIFLLFVSFQMLSPRDGKQGFNFITKARGSDAWGYLSTINPPKKWATYYDHTKYSEWVKDQIKEGLPTKLKILSQSEKDSVIDAVCRTSAVIAAFNKLATQKIHYHIVSEECRKEKHQKHLAFGDADYPYLSRQANNICLKIVAYKIAKPTINKFRNEIIRGYALKYIAQIEDGQKPHLSSPIITPFKSKSKYVNTQNGRLHYIINTKTGIVTVSGKGKLLSSVNQQMIAGAEKIINVPTGSAILMHYSTGGMNDCRATYQWFSILPNGKYRMSKVFGSCFYLKNIKTDKNNIIFKQISFFGKGYIVLKYDIDNGNVSLLSSHLAPADTPKIVVNSWHEWVRLYGMVIAKVKHGKKFYVLRFPKKIELTGNGCTPGNLYVKSISIAKMEIPDKYIGITKHYMAQIDIPMAGAVIRNLRP